MITEEKINITELQIKQKGMQLIYTINKDIN